MKIEQLPGAWANAQRIMERTFTGVVYETWIKPLTPLYVEEDNVVVLMTNMNFGKDTIEHRYLREIANSLKAVTEEDLTVRIVSPNDLDHQKNGLRRTPDAGQDTHRSASRLKAKYIFETFVRGKSNELAYAAAVAVAEAPGMTTYNPLFLYGGVGLGKTHLMHSIGNYIMEQAPSVKVLYVTSETFTNEFVTSIRERKNEEFRRKYRDIDVLLMDDVQFISDKEGTQEELFHTFNTLYDVNKQIVISSDQPPIEMKNLESRLSSRFGMGLLVDITQPDFETRAAILEKKAEFDHILMPKDVINYIAKSISSNIRDLEGALNKVAAYSKLSGHKITVELAERAIQDLISDKEKREITVEYIQEVVARHYNVTPDEMRGKKRTQNITAPRHIAMYLSRKMLSLSSTQLGALFGGRDHSTIIHGCDKIASDMENDPNLRGVLEMMEARVRGESV